MIRSSTSFIILLFLSLYTACAAAEQAACAEWTHSAETGLRYYPSSKIEGTSGKVKLLDAFSAYRWSSRICGAIPFELGIQGGYIGIDDTAPVELPPHLSTLKTEAEITLPFFTAERTYLRLSARPSWYEEDLEVKTSAFRIPSAALCIYQPDQKWTFLGGAAYYPDFDYEVFPVAGFIYKPDQRIEFHIAPPGPFVSCGLSERISVSLEADFINQEFEVSRGNAEGVVLKRREIRTGAGVKFLLNNHAQGTFSLGAVRNRYLKYRDGAGKVSLENGLYAELNVKVGI